MAKSLSNSRRIEPGEFLIYEVNQAYNRDSGLVKNDGLTGGNAILSNIRNLVGQPVKGVPGAYQFATSANVTAGALVTGFIVDGPQIVAPIAANGSTLFPYSVLSRGSAILNEGKIPANDIYGNAIVPADYITEANRLEIQTKPVPTSTSVQTT